MYKAIRTIAIGIFLFAVVAMRITRHFGLEKWQVSLGLVGLGKTEGDILYSSCQDKSGR
jgi:hypothetical protein